MIQSRRTAPRTVVKLPIRIDGPRGSHHLTVRDLSIDGLFVECGRPYEAGTRLECLLNLGLQKIEATAEVRHQTNTYRTEDSEGPYKGMGIRFVRLGTDALMTLQTYLAQLTSPNSGG
ncbi:MAG: PilZ domain-containing protein [Myxococcota bacterium]